VSTQTPKKPRFPQPKLEPPAPSPPKWTHFSRSGASRIPLRVDSAMCLKNSAHPRLNNLVTRGLPGTTLSQPTPSVRSAPYCRAFPSYFTRPICALSVFLL
jgi:hypothetical protein